MRSSASRQSRLVPQGSIWDMIDVVVKLMPFRARWTPVDNFVQLGGISACLRVSFYHDHDTYYNLS